MDGRTAIVLAQSGPSSHLPHHFHCRQNDGWRTSGCARKTCAKQRVSGTDCRQMTPFTDSAFGAGGEVVTGRYYLVEAGAWD